MEIEGEEGKVSVVNSEDPLLEVEGEEGKVSVVNSEDPLLEVLAGSDCISSSVQVPAEADVTQQKGKHCYQYYKLLLVSRTKLMFQ